MSINKSLYKALINFQDNEEVENEITFTHGFNAKGKEKTVEARLYRNDGVLKVDIIKYSGFNEKYIKGQLYSGLKQYSSSRPALPKEGESIRILADYPVGSNIRIQSGTEYFSVGLSPIYCVGAPLHRSFIADFVRHDRSGCVDRPHEPMNYKVFKLTRMI